MQYSKIPLTYANQSALLISRGLIADPAELEACLRCVNYYRLSAYLHPLRDGGGDNFKPNTTLEKVWRRYCFDRQLRILVLDAIERIEVYCRTNLSYELAHKYGPFGYLDPGNLPFLKPTDHKRFIDEVAATLSKSHEDFAVHFRDTYSEHAHPPLWVLAELLSFGQLVTLHMGSESSIQTRVSESLGLRQNKLFKSWLRTLAVVRNIAAHHCRLWNRHFTYQPLVPFPDKYPLWHSPRPDPNRLFFILLMLRQLLKKSAPGSKWKERVEDLFSKYSEIPLDPMGMPSNWREHPVWK